MSQLFNPIQTKLSKMRSSQTFHNRIHTQTQSTPIKIQPFIHTQKYQLTYTQKNIQLKQQSSSLRKIILLQNKNTQKLQMNNFFLKQLKRRKKKYQQELLKNQVKYQKQIFCLEDRLMKEMSKQEDIDQEIQQLNMILEYIGSNKYQSGQDVGDCGGQSQFQIERIRENVLRELLGELGKLGIVGNQLLYSVETVVQNKSQIISPNKIYPSNILHQLPRNHQNIEIYHKHQPQPQPEQQTINKIKPNNKQIIKNQQKQTKYIKQSKQKRQYKQNKQNRVLQKYCCISKQKQLRIV